MARHSRILINLTSITIMRFLSAGLSFLLIMVIARMWGPVFLGQFSTLFSYFMFLQQLPLLGLHLLVARAIAGEPGRAARITINSIAISSPIGGLLVLALGIIGWSLYPRDMHLSFWLVGLSCLPTAFTVVAESVLTGQEKIHRVARTLILENLFRISICLLLLWAGLGLSWFFLAFFLGRIVAVAIYWKMADLSPLLQPGLLQMREVFGYLKHVPVFFGILIFSVVFGRIDFILLSKLGSLVEVGYYSPAYMLYELGMMLPNMLALVMFPVFTRLWQGSRPDFQLLHYTLTQMLFGLGLPLMIILAVLAGPVIILLFGPEYASSISAMRLLALDQLQASTLLSSHHEDLDLKTLALSFGLHILLLVFLIPAKGSNGAALAALLTSITRVIIRYYFTTKHLQLPFRPNYLASPVTASLVMCSTLWMLKDHQLGAVLLLSSAVYFVVWILTRGLTRESLRIFHQVMTEGRREF